MKYFCGCTMLYNMVFVCRMLGYEGNATWSEVTTIEQVVLFTLYNSIISMFNQAMTTYKKYT